MQLKTIGYYFREAYLSLIRNSWLSLASVGTVTISLLILGSSLLMIINANHLADSVEDTLEISIFLKNKVANDRIREIETQINNIPGVSHAEFVPKEQALEEMKKDFGDQKDILEGLEEKDNPLPDGFKIKTNTAQQVVPVSKKLEKLTDVDQVRYGQGVVEKLLAITGWLRISGFVAMVLLSAASVFLISNSIRLSVYARRREISIMKVLGATNWFVRLPFVLEGVILGVLGAVLALIILHFSYYELVERMEFTIPFIRLVTERQQILPYMGSLLVLGIVIGALGSIIPMRKFLKV